MPKVDLCYVMPYFIIGLMIYQEQAMPSQPSKKKKRVKTLVIATLTKSFNLPDNREVPSTKLIRYYNRKCLTLRSISILVGRQSQRLGNEVDEVYKWKVQENRRKKYDSNAITLTFDERGGARW
ncbi:hypothetical protein ACFE04_023102 [Oxalis oulophora]